MAITRAQQYRQMLKDGSKEPVEQAGVMNYMPSEMVTVPKIAKSSPDTPTAKLAYITPEEQDVLIDLNLYGSLDGKPNRGPGGIPSLEGDFKSYTSGMSSNKSQGRDRDFQQRGASKSDYAKTSQSYKDSGKQQVYDGSKNTSPKDSFVPTTPSETPKAPPKKPKKTKDNSTTPNIFKQYLTNNLFTKGLQSLKNSKIAQFNNQKQRESYLNNLQITNPELYQETIDDLEKLGYYNPDPVEYYGPESKGAARDIEQFPDLYEDQAKSILNTVRDNFDDEGNATVGTLYDDYLDSRNTTTGGGGGGDQQQTDPCLGPNPPAYCAVNNDPADPATPTRNLGGLAPRFAGSIFDFTGLADGGRAGAMDGGRMMMMANQEEDDPTGGIMDLESGRQMYFLGKLVKKATRAVKKVVKSPIGKAALLYFGGNALMGKMGGLSGLKGSLFGTAGGTARMTPGILGKLGITGGGGAMMPTLKGGLSLGLGIPFALDALGIGKEEDDDSAYKKYMEEMRLDIPALRGRRNLAAAFDGSTYNYEALADGGRTGYQEGSEEPVAKETMPLIDMDGKEMDLREDGGFVPLGRMERADDVPARLSKNEFVFTADAVRNAGEGDIDKGAEVMYNMMKNLESGGEVSEESQGLDGAREMFKTSQRLEEVL